MSFILNFHNSILAPGSESLNRPRLLNSLLPKGQSCGNLSRSVEIKSQTFLFRKIKGELLINTVGIVRKENQVNIATAERAFLDLIYLNPNYYFDNLNPLNKKMIFKLLPIYQSQTMNKRITKLFQND